MQVASSAVSDFVFFAHGCAELFYTERAHLRMLKVLDNVFYQRMTREAILPPADIKNIFTNLEEVVQLHGKEMKLSLTIVELVMMMMISNMVIYFFFLF